MKLRETISPDMVRPLPTFNQVTVLPEHLDQMGHLNVRWYVAFYDQAAWNFLNTMGMTTAYFETKQGGMFALEQFVRYLAEVHLGDKVTIHTRLLERTAKRIHFMHFLLNETQDTVASTFEVLSSHADLVQRRTSPFPPQISEPLDQMLAEHQQLTWSAPICGVMQV